MQPKVTFGSKNFKPPRKPVIVLGVFDGVHRGHRALFRRAIVQAKKIGGTAVAYTFDPHPAKILAQQAAPLMINTLSQKIELILALGIPRIVVEKFTRIFSHQTPERFFSDVIVKRLKARELFAGYNFTFGVRRTGTTEHLVRFGQEARTIVHVVEPQLLDSYPNSETLVSSTQIRQLLARGNLPQANQLLARPYFMEGVVIRGRGIGRSELGCPTANLKPENDLILPTGVYVTSTLVDGKRIEGVTNIGCNPTFRPTVGSVPLSIETHLFNFQKNVAGKRIRIEFLKKIREEIAFSSPKDLAAQIQNDIKTAKYYFEK